MENAGPIDPTAYPNMRVDELERRARKPKPIGLEQRAELNEYRPQEQHKYQSAIDLLDAEIAQCKSRIAGLRCAVETLRGCGTSPAQTVEEARDALMRRGNDGPETDMDEGVY